MGKKLNAVAKAVYGTNPPEDQQNVDAESKSKPSKNLTFDEEKNEGYSMTNYDLRKKNLDK